MPVNFKPSLGVTLIRWVRKAVQAAADTHDTPLSQLPGLAWGLVTTDQLVPFHFSMSAFGTLPSLPTAVQAAADTHDTLERMFGLAA